MNAPASLKLISKDLYFRVFGVFQSTITKDRTTNLGKPGDSSWEGVQGCPSKEILSLLSATATKVSQHA